MTQDPSPPFKMAVCWDGVVATVTVTGEVDCTTASALASRLPEVAAAHPERLTLITGSGFAWARSCGL
jgi:hypothetical protein